MDFYRYWGKASRQPEAGKAHYHLLVFHSLDVAAVGWCLLDPEQPLCQTLAQQLGVDRQWLQQWFSFCLMLHDIGKFGRGFQGLVPQLSSSLVSAVPAKQYLDRHDSVGFRMWQVELRDRLGDLFSKKEQRAILPWLKTVCGHHGTPPKDLGSIASQLVPNEDIPAAEAFVRALAQQWLPDLAPLTTIDKSALKRASWQLAGLAVLSDWLGSDQTIFHYDNNANKSLKEYWLDAALPAAQQAINKSELQPKEIAHFTSITQQFDFIAQPTPLQAWAEQVEINDSPQLFILEDVTGAGKTEAAMVLSHRLLSAGLAQGLYVGLPTMATANGMYDRLRTSYTALFEHKQDQAKPSLVLAHSASKLSQAFQDSICLPKQLPDRSYGADGDASASAYCNSWLADSRKKALLADVGVGTIDQALLAVLPARHQSLRLFGLKGKVLLVDEVHAYDPYMRSLLSALLEAHSAQGGSAILLSATLPYEFRCELVNAYRQGRGMGKQNLANTTDYPLVTQCNDQCVLETAIETRASVKRTVGVKRLADVTAAIELIVATVQQGRCIAWVCNTIGDARTVYQKLKDDCRIDNDKLTLFHSRFAMVDRQTIEGQVNTLFGKRSCAEVRKGQVLIATQVIEQSLDLDFDVLISDLAPIDLLIQRAGRLQRHIRDQQGNAGSNTGHDQRPAPCLYLHGPDPEHVENGDWLRDQLPGTQSVYNHVGQLWLGASLLLSKQQFAMPEDARELIEGVYGEAAQNTIPAVLQKQSDQAMAENSVRRSMGNFNRLELARGYTLESAGRSNGWSDEQFLPTRLNEVETITAVLAVPDASGQLQPWAQHNNPTYRWPLSQITLPLRDWQKVQSDISSVWQGHIEQLQQDNPSLRYLHIVPLTEELAQYYDATAGWSISSR